MKKVIFLGLFVCGSIFASIDHKWEAFVKKQYAPQTKQKKEYRDYGASDSVRSFYKENHEKQTIDFVLKKQKEYEKCDKAVLSVWQVFDFLDSYYDESDPDTDLSQSQHAFQTAQAIRKDGHPRWLILTGLLHDLGKILGKFGEPQWAVVGDIFPVGCAPSEKIIFHQFFENNPDYKNPQYSTQLGIYKKGCGFRSLYMSFGHDWYLYTVMKDYLPEPALYILRFHSFYAAHREDAYEYFMDDYDRKMMPWLKIFSQYDLYSKNPEPIDFEKVKLFYQELVAEFLPEKLYW